MFSELCKEAELQYYKRMFDSCTNNMKQYGEILTVYALLITTNESQMLLPKQLMKVARY